MIDTQKIINDYIDKSDWRIKENSNMGYSLQGLNNHIVSHAISDYWFKEIYPKNIIDYHIDGAIHIHDLSSLSCYCFTGDTKVRLLDGRSLSFVELSREYAPGEEFWVFSRNKETNEIVPGKARNARITRANERLIEVTLDNGEKIKCTPDHRFILRNGTTKMAKEMFVGESLSPLYIDKSERYQNIAYEPKKRMTLHRYIAEKYTGKKLKDGEVVHHKNGDKRDNRPENLEILEDVVHRGAEVLKTMETDKWKEAVNKMLVERNKSEKQREIVMELVKRRKRDESGRFVNHKVTGIRYMQRKEDVYCITVREHGNFALDAGVFVLNCGGWDLKDLLIQGFTGVTSKVASKPPRHLRSALGQLVNFMYTMQGEMAGAQAVSSFDTYLAPFVRVDNLTYGEVKQHIQEFVFNMNVPTRVGFQAVFSNITMDITPSNEVGNEPVIVGGVIGDGVYKDYQKEIDMINLAFCDVMMAGDADGRIFSFPIPTYNITKEFSWDSPVANKLFEMTSKYGVPYFSNFINSDMSPSDVRSMCPLSGDSEILIESSRGWGLEKINLYSAYHNLSKKKEKKYRVYTDSGFSNCIVEKYDNQEMIEVELVNGHKIEMTKTHANITTSIDNKNNTETISGAEITTNHYLPYSLKVFDSGIGGTEELGFVVGCFAGDGSLSGDTSVVFSLSIGKKEETLKELIRIVEEIFGARWTAKHEGKNISFAVKSKAINGLCRDFVSFQGREKRYNPNIFLKSEQFRRGVLRGHYATDGGNSGRIYTSSEKMVEDINMLAATLGTTTNVAVDKRGICDGSYSENPIYTVRVYKFPNDARGDDWHKHDGYVWFRVKSIKETNKNVGYCLTIDNEKNLFTVANTGIVTHNCRLRISNKELRKRGGGLFGANPLTGSQGIVTINLPRIGYFAVDETEYIRLLDDMIDVAKRSLIIKRDKLEEYTEKDLYPYARHYLKSVHDRFGKYWKNHFSTIGIIGMNESLMNFNGDNITTKTGVAFAKKILEHIREKLVEIQEETNDVWNLEATPAEGTTRRLAAIDKKRFPDIIVANETAYNNGATPYYTNSTHLPVGYTDDVFEALDLQDGLQTLYSGGTVHHIYLGEAIVDYESTKKLVKTVAENYRIPYFTITPSFSICPVHGYLSGVHEYCPKCDNELITKLDGKTTVRDLQQS